MWTIPPQPCGAGDRKQLWACWSIIISGTDATEARFGARLSSVQHYSSASAHWQSVSTTLQGPCRSMICLAVNPVMGCARNRRDRVLSSTMARSLSESLCPFRLPAASILVHNRPFRPFWLKGARSGCSHNQNGLHTHAMCRAREHVVAMKWLAWLLRRRRKDAQLVSQMGYIQLVVGDTAAAALSFRQACSQRSLCAQCTACYQIGTFSTNDACIRCHEYQTCRLERHLDGTSRLASFACESRGQVLC